MCFRCLLSPPGETYDSIAEGEPPMGRISESVHEHVPLLDPNDPEMTELGSSGRKKGKIGISLNCILAMFCMQLSLKPSLL